MPVKFGDLGKAGNDLFGKGFEHGNVKLELKTKTTDGVAVTAKGTHNNESSAIKGTIEGKYNVDKIGEITKTWSTANVLDFELANSSAISGGKLTLTGAMTPAGGITLGQSKLNWSNDKVNINLNSGLTMAPKLTFDCVANVHKSADLGFALGFDVGTTALTSKQVALSINQGTMNAVFKSALAGDVNFIAHNKVRDNLAIAVKANYGKSMDMALAAKTACGMQYKIDQNGMLGLSHATKLDSGCNLTLSAMVDLRNMSSGGHQVGCQFKFDL